MQTAFHFCIILTKLEFDRQILVKIHKPIYIVHSPTNALFIKLGKV